MIEVNSEAKGPICTTTVVATYVNTCTITPPSIAKPSFSSAGNFNAEKCNIYIHTYSIKTIDM